MITAKITARYPKGICDLTNIGIWQINVRMYLWGFFPYWKTIEEIPQVDIDECIDMGLPKVYKRIAELGLKVKE